MSRRSRTGATLASPAPILPAAHGVIAFAALAALTVALWLTTRPYFGLFGDARLYAVQALNTLHPGRFADDMFFKFGSQDQFTLFSRVYAPFLAHFGVGHGALVMHLLVQSVWLGGLVLLVQALTRDAWKTLLVAAVVIALPAGYGGLQYGEYYLTPRVLSEGLSMAALAALLRGRAALSLLVLLASATMHPLMTLPALGVWFIYQVSRNRLLLLAAAVPLVAAGALAIAGVAPFSLLGQTFDPAWFETIRLRAPISLLLDWWWSEDLIAVTVVLVAIAALLLADARERRFLAVVFAVGLGGAAVALLGDAARNVLVVDAQTWRAMWLLAVVANAVATLSLLRAAAAPRPDAILLLAGLAMLLFARFVPLAYGPAALTLLAAALARKLSLSIRAARLLALAMAGVTLVAIGLAFTFAALQGENFGTAFASMAMVGLILAAVWLLTTAMKTGALANRRVTVMVALVAIAACAVTSARWDQRTPWTRYVESADAARDAGNLIPAGASVYWDGGVEMLWLGLDRPSYFSCTQGVGVVFSRGTAMAYAQRRASLFPLKENDFDECVEPDGGRQLNPRATDLQAACVKQPDLDYVVLGRALPGVASREWAAPVALTVDRPADRAAPHRSTRRFFIYACAPLRSSATRGQPWNG